MEESEIIESDETLSQLMCEYKTYGGYATLDDSYDSEDEYYWVIHVKL